MSSSQCNADKDLRKNGLHRGVPNSNKLKIGSHQARIDLRRWENSNSSYPHGRMESLDEFPCSGEPRQFGSIHFGTQLRQEFRRDDQLDNGQIRNRNPDRNYVKSPVNRILINNEKKVTHLLDRKVKLQLGQAAVVIFRMRILNLLSDSKQLCLAPNPNSQRSVVLSQSFPSHETGCVRAYF